MTKKTPCDCPKCQAERILDLARKQAERAPEDERPTVALNDMISALTLHAIEYDVGLYDLIRQIAMAHGEMTKQLAQVARVADREARESAKGYVQ
jgi:hypothetical protein